jgi:uncharacterized membrane protein HdeD (DUF308 family)
MWIRGIVGVLFCIAGIVWIAQGVGALHGSFMTGHSQYVVLGVVAIIVGAVLLLWAARVRREADHFIG